MPSEECATCGHTETWEHGNYFGERTDFSHHVCGESRAYAMCGPDCGHSFPGCALVPEHPQYSPRSAAEAALAKTDFAQAGARVQRHSVIEPGMRMVGTVTDRPWQGDPDRARIRLDVPNREGKSVLVEAVRFLHPRVDDVSPTSCQTCQTIYDLNEPTEVQQHTAAREDPRCDADCEDKPSCYKRPPSRDFRMPCTHG